MDDLYKQIQDLRLRLEGAELMMVDPVEFGELKGEVAALKHQMNSVSADVKQLLAMANQGKGGLWMFRISYVVAGGLLAALAPHFFARLFR